MKARFTATVGDVDPRTIELSSSSFPGFKTADITLSMSSLSNGFQVDYAPTDRLAQRPASLGDALKIRVDDDLILDGWVESTPETLEHDNLQLVLTGRSKTGDLVDSSCLIGKPPRWKNVPARTVIQDIAAAFDIEVQQVGPTGDPLVTFRVPRGEFAGDAIQRAAALRALQAYCVGGDLILAQAGATQTKTVLEEGFNIIRAERANSHIARHSLYRFHGQTRATDELTGLKAGQLKGEVEDPAITRYRPLDLRGDGHSKGDMGVRAVRERNRRAALGDGLTLDIDTPVMDEGKAWRPNMLVPVKIPTLAVEETYLITTVRYRVVADEINTTLELSLPEGYTEGTYPR